jgi:hypothetical protein
VSPHTLSGAKQWTSKYIVQVLSQRHGYLISYARLVKHTCLIDTNNGREAKILDTLTGTAERCEIAAVCSLLRRCENVNVAEGEEEQCRIVRRRILQRFLVMNADAGVDSDVDVGQSEKISVCCSQSVISSHGLYCMCLFRRSTIHLIARRFDGGFIKNHLQLYHLRCGYFGRINARLNKFMSSATESPTGATLKIHGGVSISEDR